MKKPTKTSKPATVTRDVVRRTKKQSASPSAPKPKKRTPHPNGKLGIVIGMLRSTKGATIQALSKATGWQAHSVRGAISGAVKKKLGLTVSSTKADGVRTYHISA